MAHHPSKVRLAFVVNSLVGLCTSQVLTLSIWMTYLFAAYFIEGKILRHLPVMPWWLIVVALIACLLAIGVNFYLYKKGVYDDGNPLLKSREAFRRELVASRRAIKAAREQLNTVSPVEVL